MCVCTSCCDQSSGPLSHLDHGNSANTQATWGHPKLTLVFYHINQDSLYHPPAVLSSLLRFARRGPASFCTTHAMMDVD
jgi:hypothetical protein